MLGEKNLVCFIFGNQTQTLVHARHQSTPVLYAKSPKRIGFDDQLIIRARNACWLKYKRLRRLYGVLYIVMFPNVTFLFCLLMSFPSFHDPYYFIFLLIQLKSLYHPLYSLSTLYMKDLTIFHSILLILIFYLKGNHDIFYTAF